MDGQTLGYLCGVWVVVAVSIGMTLIVLGSTLLVRAGTVLIILGLVSLMPAFKFYYWDGESDSETVSEEETA